MERATGASDAGERIAQMPPPAAATAPSDVPGPAARVDVSLKPETPAPPLAPAAKGRPTCRTPEGHGSVAGTSRPRGPRGPRRRTGLGWEFDRQRRFRLVWVSEWTENPNLPGCLGQSPHLCDGQACRVARARAFDTGAAPDDQQGFRPAEGWAALSFCLRADPTREATVTVHLCGDCAKAMGLDVKTEPRAHGCAAPGAA